MKTNARQPVGQSQTSIMTILSVAFALRLFMTFFGSRVLDASKSDLNYTDIDYNIFTDAAQLILEGRAAFNTCTSQTSFKKNKASILTRYILSSTISLCAFQVNLLMNAQHTDILRY